MTLRRTGLLAAVALLAFGAASAQAQPADPIGALLDAAPGAPAYEDEDAAEAATPTAPSPAPEAAPQAEPAPQAPAPEAPAPQASAPQTPAPQTPAPQAYVPQAPAPALPTTPQPYAPPAYTPLPTTPQPYAPPAYSPTPYTPPAAIPTSPRPYTPSPAPPPIGSGRPPRPELTEPVHIDETDRTPEAPLSGAELNYESRLRNSFASAQGLQGALDGSWTVRAGGVALYALQLVDTGLGSLDGAWRDLRRPGAVGSSGFLSEIRRDGSRLLIRFAGQDGQPVSLTLDPNPAGGWGGQMEEASNRRKVTVARD